MYKKDPALRATFFKKEKIAPEADRDLLKEIWKDIQTNAKHLKYKEAEKKYWADPRKLIYGYCDLPEVTQAKIEVHNQAIQKAKIPGIQSFWDLFKTSKRNPDKP